MQRIVLVYPAFEQLGRGPKFSDFSHAITQLALITARIIYIDISAINISFCN